MEKRTIAVIVAAVLLIPLSVWLSTDRTAVGADSATGTDLKNTITVTGDGKVYAPADEAVLNIGVTTVRATASKALGDNSSAVNKVLAALHSSGLSQDEVQTGNVSLYPQQDWQNGRAPKIISYTAQNQFVIRTKKLSKLGTVIDSATKAGATDISNLQFDLSEDNAASNNALKKAVAKARSQAETLVQATGNSLGKAIMINQGATATPIQPMMYGSMAMDQAKAAPAPTVIPQDVQIMASVTIIYEMN